PASGRIYVYDAKTPRLCLCVTAKNTRTFYLYGRIHGKPQRVRLGRFPPMTIEQARKAAAKTNSQIADGTDPNEAKRRAREVLTLGEAYDKYREDWLSLRASPATRQSDGSRFETCFGQWRGRKLSSITYDEVADLHANLGREKKFITANR